MPPQRIVILGRFGLKTGIDFASFGLGWYSFRGNYDSASKYSLFQFKRSKKEIVISEFEMDFKKSFRWRSNLGTQMT